MEASAEIATVFLRILQSNTIQVSSAMRMKFSLSNPFSNSQKNVAPSSNAGTEETSNCDKEWRSSARSDAKKTPKEKPRRKKVQIHHFSSFHLGCFHLSRDEYVDENFTKTQYVR